MTIPTITYLGNRSRLALIALCALGAFSSAHAWQGSPYLGVGVGLYQADYHESGNLVNASLGGRDHTGQLALLAGYAVRLDNDLALAAELNWHNGYGQLDDYSVRGATSSRRLQAARSISLLPGIWLDDHNQLYARWGKGSVGLEVSGSNGTLRSDDLSTTLSGIGYQRQFSQQFALRLEYQHIDSEGNGRMFPGLQVSAAATGLQLDLLYRF